MKLWLTLRTVTSHKLSFMSIFWKTIHPKDHTHILQYILCLCLSVFLFFLHILIAMKAIKYSRLNSGFDTFLIKSKLIPPCVNINGEMPSNTHTHRQARMTSWERWNSERILIQAFNHLFQNMFSDCFTQLFWWRWDRAGHV